MTDRLTITTNGVHRDILGGETLTAAERAELDYIDWSAVERGDDSVSLFRYRGRIYDLAEFEYTGNLPEDNPLRQWSGYRSDSFFSGIVVRYVDCWEGVVVGRFTC